MSSTAQRRFRRTFFLAGLAGIALTSISPTSAAASAADASRIDVGMIYADPALVRPSLSSGQDEISKRARSRERRAAVNPLYLELRDGLAAYQARWGGLPQIEVPEGPTLRLGSSGERVRALRERLGLVPGDAFDAEVADALRGYQSAHGLPSDGIAGSVTLQSLNRGAGHYERLIRVNMERARALPANLGERYVLVDAAAARLWMYEDGRPVDSMRVIVGKPEAETPMMASMIRYAVLNPYWNVPPELVRANIARNVLDLGPGYLRDRGYELLSGWEEDAEQVDPASVDWNAVAAGREQVRVRQRPGRGNFMGDIKFRMPNNMGIFLHDTPDRALFDEADRRLSSGCVRLEDAQRLARWLFGETPQAPSPDPEQQVHLREPVPVYITYFTAAPAEGGGIAFFDDVYGRDQALLAQLDGDEVVYALDD